MEEAGNEMRKDQANRQLMPRSRTEAREKGQFIETRGNAELRRAYPPVLVLSE
jgi:hypothetical protein